MALTVESGNFKFINGVSVSGKHWRLREVDERKATAIQQKYDLPHVTARIIAERGIDIEEVPFFLEPTIKHYMPDPSTLIDMDKAVGRIEQAIRSKEKITVFGDYDVDGATASSVLFKFFKSLGVEVDFYIPDRITEGYGPNAEAFKKIRATGSSLIITVDCGITSFEPIIAAKELGLEVIIIDHHLGTEVMPEAFAIVNPNRIDEKSKLTHLCAAGVSFLLAVAVNRKLRDSGFYNDGAIKEPNLMNLLDLVALGTICDVMHLHGLNRAYVAQGLKIMKSRKNVGLAALADIANIKESPSVYTLGFVLGPRINAGGRVGSSILGPTLLTTEDADEAKSIALKLNQLNVERQEIEKKILEEAMNIASHIRKEAPILIITGYGWHQGIVGIIASRIKDHFDKPAAIITVNNGVGKASSRSVGGVDIGRAIGAARANGLLISGGGHKSAAGFTLEEGKIPEFVEYMNKTLVDEYNHYMMDKNIYADGVISVGGVNVDLADKIEMIGPFGQGNYEPKFIIENAIISSTRVFAEKHLSFFIQDASVGGSIRRVKAVVFNSIGSKLGDAILAADNNIGKKFALYGKIKTSFYQGNKKCEFYLEDMMEIN